MHTFIGSASLLLYSSLVLIYCIRPAWKWVGRPHVRLPQGHERGQGLTEYGLIIVLVAVVIIGVLTVLGPSIKEVF